MTQAAPKILNEFSLLPEAKERLRRHLSRHWSKLSLSGRLGPHEELQKVLQETLPRESLQLLPEILAGNHEYAMVIHNLPERRYIKDDKVSPHQRDTYAAHIGTALYRLNHAKPVFYGHVVRKRGERESGNYRMHRDFHEGLFEHGQYIMFSSPFNPEQAPTEVVNLRQAIESIPSELRQKIYINLAMLNLAGNHGRDFRVTSLGSALAEMEREAKHPSRRVGGVSLISEDDEEERIVVNHQANKAFLAAVEQHGVKVNIQPGDLLIINENNMFHRAHPGVFVNSPYSDTVTRVLVHNQGGPDIER